MQRRVAAADWERVAADLDAQGFAVVPALLGAKDCRSVSSLYPDEARFRSHIVMARHGFGRGEYKYFAYPLPDLIAALRTAVYPHLSHDRQPLERGDGHRRALSRRSTRPSCSVVTMRARRARRRCLLQYGPGDFNCLHQDLYGEHVFPLQVAILLSEPDDDFTGGEFVLTEQRPRMQSRAAVVPLRRGDAVAFAVHHRPVRGTKGVYRVNLRHGVSVVRTGRRHTLGIIFHDAK